MQNLIMLQTPQAAAAEAFRSLRTNILLAALEKPLKTLAVAAPVMDDSKSTTTANLAIALAQAGYQTLLVDAELHHPMQHTIWGVKEESGFVDLINQPTPEMLQNVVKPTQVPNLRLLTSGSAKHSGDVMSSRQMGSILALLAESAEYILFDMPPVLMVADALLLASKLDGVLLVLKAGSTRRDQAQQAKTQLERANARIIGAALTNATRSENTKAYFKQS